MKHEDWRKSENSGWNKTNKPNIKMLYLSLGIAVAISLYLMFFQG